MLVWVFDNFDKSIIMKKTMSILHKNFIFIVFVFAIATVHAQDKDTDIKLLVESKRFVFKAQSVLPPSAPLRQLNGDNYDLKILGDSLISYLPYFGRAYTAPTPGTSGGYNFTSTKFEYTAKIRKKGGWDIAIKPKDVIDFREFNLTISKNGTASLRALSNNRQLISYNGFITESDK